ncbi:MAG: hypothetical protein KA783_05290 [Chitinophagales bacterium]|nr:hypothetical protein [Chitinophagales bacterium]
MKNKILTIWFLFLFSACEPSLKEGVMGWWVIDNIVYNNQDIIEFLPANSITFENTYFSTWPGIKPNGDTCYPFELAWRESINTDGSYEILVSGDNEIFSRKYSITFEKDTQRKCFVMKMKSDKLYIKCAKVSLFSRQDKLMNSNLVK